MRRRVMALAGVFQSAELAGSVASTGQWDQTAMTASIGSLFEFESDSVEAVFGGLGGLVSGLTALVNNLAGDRDPGVLQAVVHLLTLGKRLQADNEMSQQIRDGLEALAVHRRDTSVDDDEQWRRLGEIYVATISTLKPRIIVRGNPVFLQQGKYVSTIRACLLCGVRAGLMWHQLGGSRLQIILRGRRVLALARELKTEAEARASHQL